MYGSTMDASSFKDYILPFLFYKYLSIHQEEYLVNNDLVDISDGKSVNEAYRELVEDAGLEACLIDIAGTLGYAINPEDTWASLTESIHNGSVIPSDYQRLFENFNKNAEINKEAAADFRGIFNYINLGDSGLGSTTAGRTKTLNAVVTKIDEIEYKDENGKDILGEIYEYLIGKFAANATMGSGSLLLTVRNELPDGSRQGAVSFYGQELNTVTYNLARMNLMMHGVTYNNMTLNNADTLESDWPDGPDRDGIDRPRSFDAVVANPPYSAKWDNSESKLKDPRFSDYGKLAPASKADYAFILHSLYHLNNEGTMAIVLPHGVLFRGAAEGKIRQTIIEKNYLDAVIGLPANLFYGTSIPTTILVFKKNRTTRDVLFIDASNEFEKGKNQNNLRRE
ncbi:MAG: N-6 DNA methylase [Veillonella sp.]|nr:N-6 DNA methylase [Veillonella sp.]